MFTDTHCHLSHVAERGENLGDLLNTMTAQNFPFVLDIGTRLADFGPRLATIRNDRELPAYLHFSCGLWPDGAVIADRMNALKLLENDLLDMENLCAARVASGNLKRGETFVALGECGLDRFWNGPAAPVDGSGTRDIAGEEELFGLQLDIARGRNLPVVVHSREAFEATLACIKNADYDKGVIHCYSYGIHEARAFLDRGWYISFPGNITWAKKEADRERIASLVRYVPHDRLLLETDAPYLTPAPHRGKTNTPLLIEYIYGTVAGILGLSAEELALLVYKNARELFAFTPASGHL